MDFSGVTILCIGDVMLDRFVHGRIERISPEAPIPVLHLTRTQEMLGGAGNVAHNIAALGGRAVLVGLVGQDSLGDTVARLAGAVGRIRCALVASPLRPTICKTRFIASQQQIVRADEESRLPLQPAEQDGLLIEVDRLLPAADAVILSDYGKGVLSAPVIEAVIAAARSAGKPVFVDPKSEDFGRYRGATCITPNLRELAAASKLAVDDEAGVAAASRRVLADAAASAILATRSEHGMMLVEADGAVNSVPTHAREVFDVSGAGDTVIATMALAHGSGLSLVQAMHVANAAAGVVVSKLGTATATVDEVLHELQSRDDAEEALPGLRPLAGTLGLVQRWKAQGLRVGFTNGCFDLLHPGHVALLRAARGRCDRLVVGLNADASVARLKGPGRPVNPLAARAQVMAAISYVDCVVAFEEDTPRLLIEALLPDVLVKGADYALADVVGADIVQAHGGEVLLAALVDGQSTTATLARLRAGVTA